MKPAGSGTKWVVIIATLLAVFVAIILAAPYLDGYVLGPAKGAFNRTFRAPPIVRASFIEDLDPQQARAQIEKFLSVYRSGRGSYGLRRTVTSGAGAPIGEYVITEDGKLTFVMDRTRDRESTREFSIVHPSGVGLAPSQQGTNTVSSASGSTTFYLISYVLGRGIAF